MQILGCGSGRRVVSVLTLYPDDPSSSPAEKLLKKRRGMAH